MKGTLLLVACIVTVFLVACGGEDETPEIETRGQTEVIASAEEVEPTATPVPKPTRVRKPKQLKSKVNANANLRYGPGTNYPKSGGLKPGDEVIVSGRNEAGDWIELTSELWIAAFLLDDIPPNLIVREAPPLPTNTPAPAKATTGNTSGSNGTGTDSKATRVDTTKTNCPNPGVQITSPARNSQFNSRLVVIKGTASIPDFSHYKIEYSLDPNSNTWNFLFQREEPVTNGLLMELNTSTVPSGPYGIRLTAVDRTGNYPEPCIAWYRNRAGSSASSIPPSGWGCDCSRNRYDCSNFTSHDQAQACFNYCVSMGRGDIHKLDRDNDGIACE